jgi:hypothetical protein
LSIDRACNYLQDQIEAVTMIEKYPDDPRVLEEANANELTGAEDADPISGFPNLKSLRCRIQKI